MKDNINLVPSQYNHNDQEKKNHGFFYKLFKKAALFLVGVFIFTWILSSSAAFSGSSFGQAIGRLPVISQFRMLLGDGEQLSGAEDDRINFLLMGIGGAGHDGALLTDTIMLGSIKLSTKEAALISIPRDLLVKIPGNGYQRINNASAYGDLNNYEGGGSALAAKTVSETFGIPIHYWLRIDFQGFKKVIDELGGVDVEIEKNFTDNQYPTNDYKIQTIAFEKGWEHMNGDRALQFARSRHGNNGEGSDFARSKRQQKILTAVKNKLMSWKVFLNPNKLYKILDTVKDHTQTNLETREIPEIINIAKDVDFKNIKNYVIDDSPGGLLKPATTESGAFVLVPKSGDYSDLQYFGQNIFTMKQIAEKNMKIIVVNGTNSDGLATYVAASMESLGFRVERIANSQNQNFEKTVIYDLSQGANNEVLKFLKEKLNAHTDNTLPEFLTPILYKKNDQGQDEPVNADFMIVAGYDRAVEIQAINEWRSKQEDLNKKSTSTTNSLE